MKPEPCTIVIASLRCSCGVFDSSESALRQLVRLSNAAAVALGIAFAPARLGDRGFAAKAIEHNADLLFRPMVLPSCASDVADNAFRRRGRGLGFLSHLRSLAATMSQKSSLPQAASSVSQVLKRDRCGSSLPPHGASESRVGCRGQRLPTTRAWTWISVSSSLLGGYDEPEILPSSSC